MSAFNIWKENPPAREAVVMGRYSLTGSEWQTRWQLIKTCRRGCCCSPYPKDSYGPLILPKYWREPTAEELAAVIDGVKDA